MHNRPAITKKQPQLNAKVNIFTWFWQQVNDKYYPKLTDKDVLNGHYVATTAELYEIGSGVF